MIIRKLLELCLSLLTSLLSNVGSIPALPEQILTIFQTVINYMVSGIDLLGLFIGPTALTFIGVCLDVIIALNLFYFGYSCVMWFVKKIPFLGINTVSPFVLVSILHDVPYAGQSLPSCRSIDQRHPPGGDYQVQSPSVRCHTGACRRRQRR